MSGSRPSRTLLVRADASADTGTGHVMRCLALAQAWQDMGGDVEFVSCQMPEGLRRRLTEDNIAIQHFEALPGSRFDVEETINLVHRFGAGWVVLDGYHFDTAYQERLKATGVRLVVIDDNAHLERYLADVLVNQNVHAARLRYSSEPYTSLLLGPRYALLRREFLQWRNVQRDIPAIATRLLVTFGGSDPGNGTVLVLQALEQVGVLLEVTVVLGAANPHEPTIRRLAAVSKHRVRIESNVTDMPRLMSWADAAVSAAGSTTLELAFMGVPAILLIVAENQLGLGKALDESGAAVNLGWARDVPPVLLAEEVERLILSPSKRGRMRVIGRSLVDGLGAQRVVDVMNSLEASIGADSSTV